LRWQRYGGEQRRVLSEIRPAEWLAPDALRALQHARLQTTVHRAYEDVPHYRARGGPRPVMSDPEALSRIPIMTKDEVKAAGRSLISDRLGRKLLEIHTGGTTGKPLTVYCDRATLQRNYAFFARFRESTGVTDGERVATFAGRRVVPADAGPPYWRHNLASRTLLFSSYHISPATVDLYLDALARFGPALIDSYPSSLIPLAKRMLERGNTNIRPRAIITSSETLLPEDRADIAEAFGCPVFDHYGAAEMAALITMCREERYHVNADFGVVELLRDGKPVGEGETGAIVATGFINPVMPFIRYATGDSAVLGRAGCACGRNSMVLDRIEGRMDDVLITPDGRRVGRLDPIFKSVASLHETQIIQDRIDHVRVEVVVKGELPADEARILLEELQARLGRAMTIDLVRVPSIARTRGGKLRSVVNLVGQSAAGTSARPAEGSE
jgi:phenylacetate-CoA ligase